MENHLIYFIEVLQLQGEDNVSEVVKVQRQGRVVEIMLDRPKVNAIDVETSVALGAAFASFRDDDELLVAVLTGAGARTFSAGWDLKAAEQLSAAIVHGPGGTYGPGGFAGLAELPDLIKPVIAAVNGLAIGGGFELALACDLIVAAEHAEFALPEVPLGIAADAGGLQILPRKLPYNVAMELLLTGRRLGAREGMAFGLINRVVKSEEVLTVAHDLATKIANGAPLSVRAVKEVLMGSEHLSRIETFRAMRAGKFPTYTRMTLSEDAKEGPRAFAQKRAPRFKGA
jgi:crotonobetainyl-CoA hydratase